MRTVPLVSLDKATLDNGDILVLPCTVNFYLIETEEQAKEAIEELLPIVNDPNSEIAIDVETNGFDPFINDILLLQIGIKDNIQYIFDARKLSLEIVKPLLDTACWKVGHNLKFDGKFIKQKLQVNFRRLFDTFLAEMVIRGGTHFDANGRISYALDAVLENRLGVEMMITSSSGFSKNPNTSKKSTESAKKIMQKSFLEVKQDESFSEAQLAYAAQDVSSETIFKLVALQRKELSKASRSTLHDTSIYSISNEQIKTDYLRIFPEKLSLWKTALLEFKFLEVVIDMELSGIGFSTSTHAEVISNIEKDYKNYRLDFLKLLAYKAKQKTLFGSAGINPDSSVQVLTCLNELNLKLPDTSADTLDLALKTLDPDTVEHKIVTSLVNYRATSKLIQSFGDQLSKYVHPVTKRIHFEVKQVLDTGRISNLHPNLQQIPKKIEWKLSGNAEKDAVIKQRLGLRECFQARPGYRLVISDYSQQELRVAAAISLDAKMVKAFVEGKELHSYSATLMYDSDYDEFVHRVKVQKDPEAIQQRTAAKVVSFGALYGSGAPNLSRTLHISLAKAQEILTRFWEAYPALEAAMQRYGEIANTVGYSNTVLGRRRYYSDIIQKIKWVSLEDNPDNIQRYITDLGMTWFTEKYGPVTGENIDLARSKVVRKYKGAIARQAANHHIQGTSADMTKLAAICIRRDMQDRHLDATIVGLVHDEIIVECRVDQVDECKDIVNTRMRQSLHEFCPNIPAEADGAIDIYWRKE